MCLMDHFYIIYREKCKEKICISYIFFLFGFGISKPCYVLGVGGVCL